MKTHWLRTVGVVAGIFVVVLLALPFLININSFRPKIEAEASSALGRKVTLGNLKLSIFSGVVEADNIAIADDPAFSTSPFVTAHSLKIGIELMPLIFSRQLHVTRVELVQPQVTLIKDPKGTWNFSSLGGAVSKNPVQSKPTESEVPNLSVALLSVSKGKVIVGRTNSSRRRAFDNVNIRVTNFSPTSQFPFQLTALLPGGGSANIAGKAGPITAADAAKTPFDTAVKVNDMDIGAFAFMDAATGIGGLASFDGTLSSNGSQAKAIGTFTGVKLKLSPKASPAARTVVVRHTVDVDLDSDSATLTQGDISLGRAHAHLTGTVQSHDESQVVNLKLNAPDMPVEELEAMLPALGINLPSASRLKGGTLSMRLDIAGPVDKLVITGPIRLADSSLAGFDMGAKMGGMAAFAGKAVSKPDTEIQNFSLDARVAPEGTKADNINLNVPAIGVVTGGGTVSPQGALDFKMLANLSGGMAGSISKVASSGGSQGGIPFAITGTTSDPHFVPAIAGAAGEIATGAVKSVAKVPGIAVTAPTNAVGGLIGKRSN
jgi:AsmA protein